MSDKRPQAHDFATVGEFAEALIEHLVREEFAKRDADVAKRDADALTVRMIEKGML